MAAAHVTACDKLVHPGRVECISLLCQPHIDSTFDTFVAVEAIFW